MVYYMQITIFNAWTW